jgi:iron complex outermembrane receptor protein
MKSAIRLAPFLLGIPFADADAQQRDSAASDSARKLAPVTIVGARAPRLVVDVPFAITIVDRSEFVAKRGYGLEDALGNVPGVFAQTRSGSSDVRITIRGFGARGAGDRSNAGTSRGIRVITDGVPETEPDGRTSFDLVDLAAVERIDVVRSNVSSLWGNAAGGVISISTRPTFTESFAEVQQIAGSYGYQRSVARGGTALGDSKLSATFVNTRYDGWRAGSDARRVLLSLGLTAPLSDRTTLGVQAMGTNNLMHVPGPLTREQADSDPAQANATYRERDERRYNRLGRIALTLDHAPDATTGVSGMMFVAPKYLQRSERGTFRDFTRYHLGGHLIGHAGGSLGESVRHTITAGVDGAYQDGAILFYSLSSTGTRGTTLRDNKREGARNTGAFLQEEIWFGERTLLSLGARYDNIGYHNQSFMPPALGGSKEFARVTPKLGATYHLGEDHTVYASIGGGIEAPAGNETDPASTFGQDTIHAINPLLEPIRSTTYELGTKHLMRLGGGPLRNVAYDVAAYVTEVRNEIVPYRGGRFYFTAGSARRAGLELGTTLRAKGGVSLVNSFTVSRNRYSEYRVDSVHYDQSKAGRFADFTGNSIVGIPNLYFGTTLDAAPPALRGVGVQLGVQGASSYFADDANSVIVPGFATASAGISYTAPVRASGIAVRGFLTVNNLFDRRHIASAFLNPDVVNGVPVAFEPALPRNVVMSVSLSRMR